MFRPLNTFALLLLACMISLPEISLAQKQVKLTKGMKIDHSVLIKKDTYTFLSNGDKTAAIEIKGSNIEIDFNGAVLVGNSNEARPDKFSGIGIHIVEGSHITIKNAVIKGFKIGLLAKGIDHLVIENCDLSYNFRQHLGSTRLWEDPSDWQSYHHNEKDEWMRFGAAMYLRNCDSIDIKDNKVNGGQCGLMITNCNGGTVYNNDFSFNSGIGIGLYRSSNNRIMNNKLDWNIRGVSYGYYYRGQDAAAILVYEQSSHNVFAYNSATHSGDGFFLWAGASTLQTGKGGCNDNLIYGNDFSFAPTNGIEATFSRNKIVRNKVEGCDNGVWAGYSYETLIKGNEFKDNNTGIAIEQGQQNMISGNTFLGGQTGIHLWATPGRRMEGQYDALRDVRSMKYNIENNLFSDVKKGISISHSEDLKISNNRILGGSEVINLNPVVKNIVFRNNGIDVKLNDSLAGLELAPHEIIEAKNAMLPEDHPKGKQYLMITEWGPYDFRSPILWWNRTDNSVMHFDILGPAGTWKVKTATGIKDLSSLEGTVPGKLSFIKKSGENVVIKLTYNGQEVVSPFGKKYPAGAPYIFGYNEANLAQNWDVKLFSFDKLTDPLNKPEGFRKMLESSIPIRETTVHEINNSFWHRSNEKLPVSKTALKASAILDFPKGNYVIGVSAGEMVRIYIDGKLFIDAWNPDKVVYDADYHHEKTVSLRGKHTIVLEQAQYGSYGFLYFSVHLQHNYN